MRELVTILLLIVAVWVVDVFVLRDAYDQDYFIVQRSVREANDHCRDMVIDKRARGVYEVRTCGELRVYELEGGEAKKVEVREIGGDRRGRR